MRFNPILPGGGAKRPRFWRLVVTPKMTANQKFVAAGEIHSYGDGLKYEDDLKY